MSKAENGTSDAVSVGSKDDAKEDQLSAIVKAVNWHLEKNNGNTAAVQQVIGHILREAYKTGKLTAEYVIG